MDIAHIDTEDGGQVAVVPPVYNYACRGPNLRHLNVLEYASLLVLEKGEPKENVRNARFLFHSSHVMVQQWRQQLLSQFRVPILTGKKLPPWPGQSGNDQAKSTWAQYVQTLLVPWDIDHPPALKWSDLERTIHAWSLPSAFYLERCYLELLGRLRRFGHFDKIKAYLATLARQRNRKMWGIANPLDLNYDPKAEAAALRAMHDTDRMSEVQRRVDGIKQAI